jgi:hypothetical protein
MERQNVVISLDIQQLQQVERIVLDDDQQAALTFVKNVIKPAVDAALGKGHCRPVFEWRRGQPEKVKPPPIGSA